MSAPYTILNVEDVKENRDLIRRILESESYRVIDAVNALDGIALAVESTPDLILMDINLPDLDGFTAITRIRSFKQLAHVPILALTARTVSNDRERAKAIGCDGYLNKPIDFDELVELVAKYIKQGRKKDEPETTREYYLKEQNVNLIGELERKFSELQLAYDRLKKFDAAKNDFISVVSHELRTPLTVIHSYSQMIKMLPAVSRDKNALELMDGVTKGVRRMQDIVNDMVSVIRVELAGADFDFMPVSVRSVIRTIQSEQTAIAAERNITLDTDVAKDLPMINGDIKQLFSALSRIVGNALKYTPDGGKVTISATHLPKSDSDSHSFVQVVVADTGVGIALDKQKMIFEKFGTASNTALHSSSKTQFMGGGVGLGLTIAKGIIDAHKGRIWVESAGFDAEKFPGSKFYILLPTM